MARSLLIGELSRRTGLTISAIRYYDEIGLLGSVPRVGGIRQFPGSVIRRIALVRAAQESGFTLAEIRLLLDQRATSSVREQWEALATRRLPELDAMILRMNQLRDTLAGCLECGCLSLTACAMLNAPAT